MSDASDSRRGPPPVEPLGDLQWARIERAVWAELDADAPVALPAPRRRTPWLIAMGAVAAAAAAVTVIAVTHGTVAPAPTPTPPAVASAAPQWVVTDVGGSEVTFGDARIRVAPRSAVVMNGTADQGVLIVIDRGGADFEVAPRLGRPKFVVQAGEVSVRVIGTAFHVERTGDRAKVTVQHGTVEVSAGGETARITAGQTWPSEIAAADAQPADDAEPAPVEMDPTPIARPHHAKPPVDHDVARATDEPKPPVDATDSRDPDARRFAAATAIEAGNPTAALAEYRRLAAAGGPWAANALYAAARLLYEHHDDAGAKAALTEYLHRFPRGANTADARALLDRLQGGTR
jgi:hypothetical protein